MSLPSALVLLVLLVALTGCGRDSPPASGGDFALLAQSAEGFEDARPGQPLVFPRDHGAHPGYRFEWWYLTANLQDAAGNQYGAQWTLFRLATRPPGAGEAGEGEVGNPWHSGQVFMAHAALTTPQGHRSFQRYARGGTHGGLAQAGAQAEPFAAWLDDWSLHSTGARWLPLQVQARQGDTSFSLFLESTRPLVLQGDGGFSQKHPSGSGSFYYSQPFLDASGTLTVDGREVAVTGQAWLDREWSSRFLQPDQVGWDWFALHLDSGEKLMLYRLRQRPGMAGEGDTRHGILVSPHGERTLLQGEHIQMEPLAWSRVAGRQLPTRWRISLPQIGRELEVEALRPDQWMDVDFAYWEGAVRAQGKDAGTSGRGYLEMTGYPLD